MKFINLTIARKITLASVSFVLFVALALLYLTNSISTNTSLSLKQVNLVNLQIETVKQQQVLLTSQHDALIKLEQAKSISESFSKMRFWLYDLSVSWLNEAEDNADQANDELSSGLKSANSLDQEQISLIKAEAEIFREKMIEAVDAYVDENRVLGNSLVAEARQSGAKIDNAVSNLLTAAKMSVDELNKLVDTSGAELKTSAGEVKASADEIVSTNNHLGAVSYIVLAVVVGLGVVFCVTLKNTIVRPIARLRNTIQHIETESDLTYKAELKSKDELGVMALALNNMMDRILGVMRDVNIATINLAESVEQTSKTMEQTNTGVIQQQNATDQVATAINEMTATVQEVASNAAQAADAAKSADDEARNGQTIVQKSIDVIQTMESKVEEANEAIRLVAEASKDIGAVLDVIRGVSEQTNLLALNAAIEAARAGEAGRGFAVVADEVRTLAQRTQESTNEIQSTIERLQSGSDHAVHVMGEGQQKIAEVVASSKQAGDSLSSITEAVKMISDLNIQIASAAEEQSSVTENINHNVSDISNIAAETTKSVADTTEACYKQKALASNLETLVNKFKI